MLVLFILSAALLLYTFIIYPLIVSNAPKPIVKNIVFDEQELPAMTVVLSVYNGASDLGARIRNIFASDYPTQKLNMLVISDGSTDSTEQVLIELSQANAKLSYIHYNRNKGKAYAINRALKLVETPFIAFCDVRQRFSVDALRNMANKLSQEGVGAVTGNLIITKDDSNTQSEPGLYWKYEKWIRDNESSRKSMVGVTGAIYMAETALMPNSIPDETILDDMYIPLHIIKNGHHIKMVNDALAFDKPSASLNEEFSRKIRTLAGNFQLITQLPWLINPFCNPIFFEWFSHKFCRLIVPYALLGLMLSTSFTHSPLLTFVFIIQWAFYLYALLSYLATNRSKQIKFGSVCLSFCTLNIAAFLAGWKYALQPAKNLWQKH